jgi:hypothetical protein
MEEYDSKRGNHSNPKQKFIITNQSPPLVYLKLIFLLLRGLLRLLRLLRNPFGRCRGFGLLPLLRCPFGRCRGFGLLRSLQCPFGRCRGFGLLRSLRCSFGRHGGLPFNGHLTLLLPVAENGADSHRPRDRSSRVSHTFNHLPLLLGREAPDEPATEAGWANSWEVRAHDPEGLPRPKEEPDRGDLPLLRSKALGHLAKALEGVSRRAASSQHCIGNRRRRRPNGAQPAVSHLAMSGLPAQVLNGAGHL